MSDLGTLGGTHSIGMGINDAGDVTGAANIAGDAELHVFLYSNGTMSDLGTLGGATGQGWGINVAGQVSGTSYIAGDASRHAFFYSNGIMIDLGTLGGTESLGLGINDAGQMVGASDIAGDVEKHAFLYSGGSLIDLNTLLPSGSAWTLSGAYDINNNRKIVGVGLINGETHAFLMTVPEPGTILLLGAGVMGMTLSRGFKRKTGTCNAAMTGSPA